MDLLDSAALTQLRTEAQRLNQASDALKSTVDSIEEFLRDLSLGMTASVVINADPEPWQWLEFVHHKGSYRIVVASSIAGSKEDLHRRRWTELNRETRTKVVKHLPALIESLYQEVMSASTDVQESLVAANSIIAAIDQGGVSDAS